MAGWQTLLFGEYFAMLDTFAHSIDHIRRINLSIIFISMAFVAHSPPNFDAAAKSLGVPEGPVVTEKFVHLPLFSKVSRMRFSFIGLFTH
jgi:hypothetical protein